MVYDIDNSKNDQFSISYVIQEDPKGPKQFVLQTWWNQTFYSGDAARASKQQSLYEAFFTQQNINPVEPRPAANKHPGLRRAGNDGGAGLARPSATPTACNGPSAPIGAARSFGTPRTTC